ncbi:Yip1 domain-containing protein [Loktanella fryxellensis]|uniref:Yip1 domain-containing protein n=2 Tax=Loktanella fryxellensis TaxID=245187 RepID=A0A1H8F9S4_9RHOB|nr:YIP1 family protein [Loktanella fryxellensis]SEN27778.1 Yip1 domain-containing protein [Loktanella fryxellensis]
MAVTTDILRTWRNPRRVMRDMLDDGPREDRALGYLAVFCLLVFVAQWPRLARQAAGFDVAPGAEVRDLFQTMTYEVFAWFMVWPLLLYGLAGISHLVAKLFRGRGTFFGARLALFWSLLASVPLLLIYGLMAGFLGPVAGTHLTGGLWVGVFGYLWLQSLREAES